MDPDFKLASMVRNFPACGSSHVWNVWAGRCTWHYLEDGGQARCIIPSSNRSGFPKLSQISVRFGNGLITRQHRLDSVPSKHRDLRALERDRFLTQNIGARLERLTYNNIHDVSGYVCKWHHENETQMF
jgi:hypothetical protein